ncbi:MAG TPA: PqqD family protein [bacterium]|nr:PqqD family protein [bacterium]
MTYVLKKKEIAYRKIGDEYFVLTTSDSTLHNVKGAGVRVVELLDEGKNEDEILRLLLDEYDAPAAEVEADLASFLAELEAKGILTRNDG